MAYGTSGYIIRQAAPHLLGFPCNDGFPDLPDHFSASALYLVTKQCFRNDRAFLSHPIETAIAPAPLINAAATLATTRNNQKRL